MNAFATHVSLLASLAMISCNSHQVDVQRVLPTHAELKGWHVAAKEPLTFCPQGHSLPPDALRYRGEYVYLADRTARFYIPDGCSLERQQALELSASSDPSATHLACKVLSRTAVTSLVVAASLIGGLPAEDSPAARMMESVWSD